MDLCALDNSYFDSGDGKIIYDWWQSNAATYGFAQPYTEGRCAGYELERWHWSYVKLSLPFLNDWTSSYANQMCNYLGQISFDGSQQCGILAPPYVTTVGPGCKTSQLCGTNWLSSTSANK
ncbi:MAG: D-alanyl-D-alanine carboxypeptidase family protein [archaeon]|nr:D-alanyl-D-alanine carboxypeptidase family protein [archaeon]